MTQSLSRTTQSSSDKSGNKELRKHVKNTDVTHHEVFLKTERSVTDPFIQAAASRRGPLVKGIESFMNFQS